MIYISSSCVKNKRIPQSVEQLISSGFSNIELSGGTEYYPDLESDLIQIKKNNTVNLMCHNYFPPPKNHFVVNLASLDNEIYETTLEHLTRSIELSSKLGAKKFAFHAGFLIDIKVNEIGKKISRDNLFDKDKAMSRFCDGVQTLQTIAKNKVALYIENNVYSHTNKITYGEDNPFLLTCYKDYVELQQSVDFNLLLDVAHLKVSCGSLGLSFSEELATLADKTDYLHISDNDGLHDQNKALLPNSELAHLLSKINLSRKTMTLEVYENLEKIKSSHQTLTALINEKVYV